MKNFVCVALFCLILIVLGCTGQQGPSGPAGSNGTPASNTFQVTFQNGVFPTSSYSGELDTWLNGGAQATPEGVSPYLEITSGTSIGNYARTLVRFDVSSFPVNATIVSAELILKTETATNIGSNPLTIGLHNLASSTFNSCQWTSSATWGYWGGGLGWNLCTGDTSSGQEGYINPTAISTVVFSTSENGKSDYFRWTIAPSVVQSWLTATSNNNGLVLKSEGEFGETASAAAFYPYNDATASNHAQLIVTYY